MGKLTSYISSNAPYLRITVLVDGEKKIVQFVKGIVHLAEKEATAIDELLKKRMHLAREIKKVDREAAEKMALEHKQKAAAVQGGITGATGFTSNKPAAAMVQEMTQQGADKEGATAAAAAIEASKTHSVKVPS